MVVVIVKAYHCTSFFVVEGEGNFCPSNLSRFIKTDNCGFLNKFDYM